MIKLFIICFIVASCNQGDKITVSKNCISTLQKSAKKDWHYKPESNCYEGTTVFYELINSNRACIKTISKNRLIEILGSPTGSTNSSVRYRLYPCDQTKCKSFEFHFDTDEKITHFTTFQTTMTWYE